MTWQLLIPVVEKLIDAGVDYYKSDKHTMGAVAATEEVAASAKAGATILLAVESGRPTVVVNEVTLRAALEDMATRNGLKLTGVEISIEESKPNGT